MRGTSAHRGPRPSLLARRQPSTPFLFDHVKQPPLKPELLFPRVLFAVIRFSGLASGYYGVAVGRANNKTTPVCCNFWFLSCAVFSFSFFFSQLTGLLLRSRRVKSISLRVDTRIELRNAISNRSQGFQTRTPFAQGNGMDFDKRCFVGEVFHPQRTISETASVFESPRGGSSFSPTRTFLARDRCSQGDVMVA